MGKARMIIQLGLALLLSLGAGFAALQWMNTQKAQPMADQNATRPMAIMVVAATNIPRGAQLGRDMLKEARYFQPELPPTFYGIIDDLVGRTVLTPIGQDEPITESRLASKDTMTGGISAIITPGKRALTVKGNNVLGMAGFIRPGNRVDVLVTMEDQNLPAVTKTVLSNVLVLATGNELDSSGSKGETGSVDTYTLELTPHEGEMLSLAATKGILHFALRNPLDSGNVLTQGAGISGTLSSLKPQPPKATPKPILVKPKKVKKAPKAPPIEVEVIVGEKSETVTF